MICSSMNHVPGGEEMSTAEREAMPSITVQPHLVLERILTIEIVR